MSVEKATARLVQVRPETSQISPRCGRCGSDIVRMKQSFILKGVIKSSK